MLAVISQQTPKVAEEALRSLGHTTLRMPPHPALPAPVASHPDMLLFFASDAILCTKSYLTVAKDQLELLSSAASKPIQTVEEEYGAEYPHDILLNAAPLGSRLFCLPRATAKRLTARADISVHAVRQGYAKCSVIPLGENAMVTSDPSIETVAKRLGIHTLLLSPQGIFLKGYDHGFLGGCAGFSPYQPQSTVYFCGNIDRYPEGERLKKFLEANRFRACSLGDFPLTDVGTIFLI